MKTAKIIEKYNSEELINTLLEGMKVLQIKPNNFSNLEEKILKHFIQYKLKNAPSFDFVYNFTYNNKSYTCSFCQDKNISYTLIGLRTGGISSSSSTDNFKTTTYDREILWKLDGSKISKPDEFYHEIQNKYK